MKTRWRSFAWPRTISARWLVAIGVAIHLVLAMSAELSPDEAHYALYGAHLDWSYFDHPPLVGWLQAPFVAIGGADLLMRVVPMASWLLTVQLMLVLCRRLPLNDRASPASPSSLDAWVALMLLVSPLLNLLGVALVPDTLLMPIVPAAMSATWALRNIESARNWRRWLVLSSLLGVSLLAKYTGIFIVIGALISLGSTHGFKLLRLPGFWLAVLVVAGIGSPIIVWNATNHWASFVYQADHAAGDKAWQIRSTLRAIALQLALYGLLLPVALFGALKEAPSDSVAQGLSRFDSTRKLCIAFGVPVLVVFSVMAGRGASLPHWTACGWIALVPLAGLRAVSCGTRHLTFGRRRRTDEPADA